MKRILSIIFISTLLTGCVTTTHDVSPRQSYRPTNSNDLWDIGGSMQSDFDQITGAVKRILSVNINGEQVIYGNLSRNATGELSGKYKNHKVNSICASELKTESWLEVRCTILIDNERAATLTF